MKIPKRTKSLREEKQTPKILWDLYRDGVTQSMLATFLTCRKKFSLSYEEGLRTSKSSSGPMEFGNCIHELLDIIYSSFLKSSPSHFKEEIDDIIKRACLGYEKVKYDAIETSGGDWDGLAENVGIAEVLLPRYFEHWDEDWEKVDWVALEQVFDIPLEIEGATIRIRGKLDGVQRVNGKLWLFETKTKGRINEEAIVDHLPIDLQVNLYLWAIWKVYGEFPKGVVYNIIRRPQLRQGKNEKLSEFIARIKADIFDRPEFYFMRTLGSIDKSEILQWEREEFIPIIKELICWEKERQSIKNVTACVSGFFPCSFLPICSQQNTGNFIRRESLFDELTTPSVLNILEEGP